MSEKVLLSDKQYISNFVDLLYKNGLRKVVISPGSRNSSLIISFVNYGKFECYSIVDERSAAFFALGMAQQLNEPVAIVCTSGSAPLNYSPAISEAYYQQIPLLVLTADRPPEMIDIGESQTIRQESIYKNYILADYTLVGYLDNYVESWFNNFVTEIYNEANGNTKGPVHINIPLRDPLYKTSEFDTDFSENKISESISQTNGIDYSVYAEKINKFKKILIVPGFMLPDPKLKLLTDMFITKTGAVMLAEHTSNLRSANIFQDMDKFIVSIKDKPEFKPDLLITFGNQLVSRKIKEFIPSDGSVVHWHISINNKIDIFNCLSAHIKSTTHNFFKKITPLIIKKEKQEYLSIFKTLKSELILRHNEYLSNTEWSDLKAFKTILTNLPKSCTLHLSNSTPVRYAQLFELPIGVKTFCNRGVSGIDGCTSTAVGASLVNKKNNFFITGDIGFLYDINALWNRYKPDNLKIFVINNGGGNIFRFIPGPDSSGCLEEFFETPHSVDLEKLASAYGIDYRKINSDIELNNFCSNNLNTTKFEIIEVVTPRFRNADILKKYFHYISGEI